MILLSCLNQRAVLFENKVSNKSFEITLYDNYKYEGISVEMQSEHRFWFPDSSVVFISTFESTLNQENIRNDNKWFEWFEAVNDEDFGSIELAGTSEENLHWTNIKHGNIIIGYSNVPNQKVIVFDKMLQSFKLK